MTKGKYKRSHITIALLIIIFKILVIASLIYIGFVLVEIKTGLDEAKKMGEELQEQINDNQRLTQEQINEISSSLLTTKRDLKEEISELKASTSDDFSGIIQEVISGVVSVGTDVSQGSGFIITDDGYIVTNSHILSGGRILRVLIYEEENWMPAELIGYDTTLDIAVLKIAGTGYKELKFGDSEDIQVGEKAIALGNPLGLSFSVSEGIVSALKRIGPNNLPAYIQIDTPLNPGNSGGPLINKKGEVIGINNFKIAGGENLGFALESNYAVQTINTIFSLNNQTIRL